MPRNLIFYKNPYVSFLAKVNRRFLEFWVVLRSKTQGLCSSIIYKCFPLSNLLVNRVFDQFESRTYPVRGVCLLKPALDFKHLYLDGFASKLTRTCFHILAYVFLVDLSFRFVSRVKHRAAVLALSPRSGVRPWAALEYPIPRARGMALVGRCTVLVILAQSFSFPSRFGSVPSSLVKRILCFG